MAPTRNTDVSDNRRTGWLAALAGIAAAAVALGVAEVLAIFTGPESSPLVAVSGVVVDHAPHAVVEFGKTQLGHWDKPSLVIGTAVILAGFAAVIGILAARKIAYGYAGIAVFGLVGAAAAVSRPGDGIGAALPSLFGALAGAAVLRRLIPQGTTPGYDTEPGRRRLLTGVFASIVGAAVVGFIGRQVGERRNVAAARGKVVLPNASSSATLPPEPHVNEQTTFVTPNSAFYRIDTAIVVPQVDPDQWTLRIHGRVDNPITITYKQLLAMPMIERYITLCCVSNQVGGPLISNAKFLGVPLKGLLEQARPQAGADQVVGRSVDGFTAGSPTAVLMDGRDAMLAVGMNDAPLPIEHGFPVRVVVPGLYGYVSATKWVAELELTSFADFDAYWVPRGWSALGPIKTESRIDVPRAGTSVDAGRVVVAGVAWAQHRGISKVEVRVDEDPWQEATLGEVPSIDTWRLWSWEWDARPGTHQLQVRATDNAAETQTDKIQGEAPDGATGWHTIEVKIR